ncbi:ATP-binding cassette domain-containing protein [Allonocardiopsis opalescens]|uniref:ABC-2 type transport system ATP-binding protein n=1 Tax=Allonocardiopsis opalescens TaxID=1144618 RepID=A0A2T0Q2U4_9ACTN|nr:ATP-binding cassette domain-containing protein [Allonocardiopsis opalescens]PRX98040.1 ABC-2 type transport system ATP-binding protein [Allonocardiopsis opalescens]
MIEVIGVSRRFGAVLALDDVTLSVPAGTVLGLLGHNGAGKTTLIEILTALCRPSAGTARVAGYDVVTQAAQLRRRIGLTGQSVALDEQISGRDNLVLIARLLGAGRRAARARGGELLDAFDLAGAADRPVRTYSGGMRRRLDLAASLIGRPDVLFLDEPTTGLDPAGRRAAWQVVRELVRGGTTVMLTTQYLDEADRLADAITVLADGRVVASGTPAELKARAGGRTATARPAEAEAVTDALYALRTIGLRADADLGAVTVPVAAPGDLAAIARALDDAPIGPYELTLTEPTLDDVYLSLMGTRRAA